MRILPTSASLDPYGSESRISQLMMINSVRQQLCAYIGRVTVRSPKIQFALDQQIRRRLEMQSEHIRFAIDRNYISLFKLWKKTMFARTSTH
jgi:hypothetical protein